MGRKLLFNRLGGIGGAATVLGVCLAACGGSTSAVASTPAAHAAKKVRTIAFVPGIYPEGYFISMDEGINAEAKKLGGYKIILQGSPQYSPETQVPILQSLLAKPLDAAIVAPTDVKALNSTLSQYKNKHVPLFLGDSGITENSLAVAVVQTNNYAGGVAAADAMAKSIHDKGTVAVESFVPGSGSGAPRVNGFLHEMKKKYPKIQVLPVQYCKSDVNLAATQVGAEITSHPDLKGIFGSNDASALGAGEAVHSAHKKMTVIAYDADPDEVKNLKSGLFTILIAQHPYDEGVILMKEVNDYFNGHRSAIKKMTTTPVTVVTKANMNSSAVHPYLYGVKDAK